jgi:hypothetical protein
LQAEDNLKFNFSYDSTTNKHGYTDSNGTFIPFESGGTDVSDTTATAANVLRGYYFYDKNGNRTQGSIYTRSASNVTVTGSKTYSAGYYPNTWTVTGLDTSDATAYAKNIESGYTAYCRGSKITGTATVVHQLEYRRGTQKLYQSRDTLAAASNGSYAIFGGGEYLLGNGSTQYSENADAYNKYLSRTVPNPIGYHRCFLSAASTTYHVLFAGGKKDTGYYGNDTSYVSAYDTALTVSVPAELSVARSRLFGGSIGEYALFAGGYSVDYQSQGYHKNIDSYNSSLTKSTVSGLSTAVADRSVASNSNYIIFFGSDAEAYTASLTKSSRLGISDQTLYSAATTVGEYCLCAGGLSGNTLYNVVRCYDSSLTASYAAELTEKKYQLAAASIPGYFALFAGGYKSSGSSFTTVGTVDCYDKSLTKSTAYLSMSRALLAGTNIGDYALFGGGNLVYSTAEQVNGTVDAYYAQ